MIFAQSQLPWSLHHLHSSLWGCQNRLVHFCYLLASAIVRRVNWRVKTNGFASSICSRYPARLNSWWNRPSPPSPSPSSSSCRLELFSRSLTSLVSRSSTPRYYLTRSSWASLRPSHISNWRKTRLSIGTICYCSTATIWQCGECNCHGRRGDCKVPWYTQTDRWTRVRFRSYTAY